MLIPWNDKRLLGTTSKTASSPLTISLEDAGILPAAHLINALIVISVISAGNSSLYVASRTLLFMSRNGKAPKFIGRTNRLGVPWVGLVFTNVFACIVFLEQSSSAGRVYSALITLSGGMFPFPGRSQKHHCSMLTKSSCYLYCLVGNRSCAYSIPESPGRARPRPIKAPIPSSLLPMGHLLLTGSKCVPRFLPGVHLLPQSF